MCLEFKSDNQKSSALLKCLFRAVKLHGHETNLGFLGFKIPPKTVLGPSMPSNFENGASQVS